MHIYLKYEGSQRPPMTNYYDDGNITRRTIHDLPRLFGIYLQMSQQTVLIA